MVLLPLPVDYCQIRLFKWLLMVLFPLQVDYRQFRLFNGYYWSYSHFQLIVANFASSLATNGLIPTSGCQFASSLADILMFGSSSTHKVENRIYCTNSSFLQFLCVALCVLHSPRVSNVMKLKLKNCCPKSEWNWRMLFSRRCCQGDNLACSDFYCPLCPCFLLTIFDSGISPRCHVR